MAIRSIGMDKPRLDRSRAWGKWRISKDGKTFVFDSSAGAHYQVSIAEISTPDAAIKRLQTVIALKSAWVTQRVLDELRRAIKDVLKFQLPEIEVDRPFKVPE